MSDSNEIPSLKSKIFNLPTREEVEIFNRLSKCLRPPFSCSDYWKSPIQHIFEEAMEGVVNSIHKILPRERNLRAVVTFEIVPFLDELTDEQIKEKIVSEVKRRLEVRSQSSEVKRRLEVRIQSLELEEEFGAKDFKDKNRIARCFRELVDERIIYPVYEDCYKYVEEKDRDFVDLGEAVLEVYEMLGDGSKKPAVELNNKRTGYQYVSAQGLENALKKLKERGRVDFIVPEGKRQKLWFRTDLVK